MVKSTSLFSLTLVLLVCFSCKSDKPKGLESFTAVTEKDPVHDFVDKKLPSGKLTTLDNQEVTLADFEGKPTMLNLWFVACAPCIDEMPILNNLKEKYADKVNFLSITFDSKEKVDKLLQKHDFEFLHLVGAGDFLKTIGAQAYPKNLFIDANGIIKRVEGGVPYDLVHGKLKRTDGKKFYDYIEELLLP